MTAPAERFAAAPWAAALLAVLLAGCQSAGGAGADGDPFAGSGSRDGLYRGQLSAARQSATLVARSQQEWLDLWARIGEPPPTSLRDGQMAVAVLLGRRDTAGYAVTIDGVRIEGDAATVQVREQVPGPAVPVAQTLTAPYAVALAPRVSGTVAFRWGG